MRIDDSSPLYAALPPAALPVFERESSAFPQILRDLLQANTSPHAFSALEIQLESRMLQLEAHYQVKADIKQDFHEEVFEDEHHEALGELENLRDEEMADDLEENQARMDKLIDRWEEEGKRLGKSEDMAAQRSEAESESSEAVDGGDDSVDLLNPLEDVPPEGETQALAAGTEEHSEQQDSDQEEIQLQANSKKSLQAGDVIERELNYEEIQLLVDTALHSKDRLSPRVQWILQALLNGLLENRRFLLDQQRMMGLERDEWYQLLALFPAHFYGGLVRHYRLLPDTLPVYSMFQEVFCQEAPDLKRQRQWQTLLSGIFSETPLLLQNWLQQQPLLFREQELKHLLEIWQQKQAFPPGAVGRTLELALAYQHHPESMERLFVISQALFHGLPVAPEAQDFWVQKIYERCYPQEFTERNQITSLLKGVLTGLNPSQEDLQQLLLGCSQAVLSYLPYQLLHPELQSLQDYILRDLMGQEEEVLQILQETKETVP